MRQMLVVLAYQKDPLLSKLVKKRHYSSLMMLAVGAGIYGTAFAQSTYIIKHIYNDSLFSTYKQAKIRQRTFATTSIVYYSLLFGGIAMITGWNMFYDRKIKKQKKVIDARVDATIRDLSEGANDLYARGELFELLKSEEVVLEYLNLWRATHPTIVQEKPMRESKLKLQRFH